MLAWVEVLKLIDAVQNVGDQLLEEQAWSDATLPPSFPATPRARSGRIHQWLDAQPAPG